MTRPHLYGVMAEFETPEALLKGARDARAAGYRRMDAYSPFAIEGLAEAVGFPRTRLPLLVLLGGVFGGAGAYSLQYWISVVSYPLNVGGRPDHSWPAFIPVTFELTVLGAALAAVFCMLALNGLPMPHHPVFSAARFARASQDRFFLCVQADDPRFDRAVVRAFLQGLGPAEVIDVAG